MPTKIPKALEILNRMNLIDPRQVRHDLVAHMSSLAVDGIDCRQCSGTCCTHVANSMAISPVEAAHVLSELLLREISLRDIRSQCNQSILRYGLDRPSPGDGKRDFFRRTYTCPFFANSALGCRLSPHAKPLGCLAFNPFVSGQTEGGSCRTVSAPVLEAHARLDADRATIANELGVEFEKKAIPLAVVEVLDALERKLLQED